MRLFYGFSHKFLRRKSLLPLRLRFSLLHRLQSTKAGAALAPGYDPFSVEEGKWQRESQAASRPLGVRCNRGTFRMLLPPPNVTGHLHLGHALMATIQDVLCRQHRALGYAVEWVPGTDHAGIATQVVVEKMLQRRSGATRQEMGRDAFLQAVWQWKREKGGGIVEDLKRLGCTLDWPREYFTMDESRAHAVNVAFVRLFEEGLIRRQRSLVNWSCALESAISDIEVDTLELQGPTELAVPGHSKNVLFGRIYDIGYRVCDSEEEVVVSTTRPETLLGDVAVAVHPQDERYLKYRQRNEVKVWHPFRQEPIPLVFDVAVEQEFGTGAVKLTPAHDRKDFEMAERHLLDAIPVFNERGRISSEFPDFQDLPRFEARERILQRLGELGLLRGVKDHAINLPICSRSKDVIEYMLRPQWFLHCQPLADEATAAVRSGRLQIIPENFEIEWFRWLDDCHDWCISRQLWWGHRVPAYLVKDETGAASWVAALNEEEALTKATAQVAPKAVQSIERDEDVLDTWFASSLLPFAAHNWPAPEYGQHYPLDVMETGHDILFFWVARMTMLGLKLTGEVPFKRVLLNGLVCDAHGRKMSKSLGNVVTPQQVVCGASVQALQDEVRSGYASGLLSSAELEKSLKGLQKLFPQGIAACGTDALRFTLCSHNIKTHFINFDVAECYANKLFLNKIWQATRFTLGAAERLRLPLQEIESMKNVPNMGLWDRWILSRLAETLQICAQSGENFNLHSATGALKQFFYGNLCDVYVETTKADINAGVAAGYVHCATLATCLSWALQALAPFTPFIAAELLRYLPPDVELDLSGCRDVHLEREIEEILDICQSVRQLKSRQKISKKHEPHVHLFTPTAEAYDALQPHLNEIKALTLTSAVHLEAVGKGSQLEKEMDFFSTAGHRCSFGLKVNGAFDRKQQNSAATPDLNERKLQKLRTDLERHRMRAENVGFRKAASAEVQQRNQEKIKALETEIEAMEAFGRG